MNLGLSWLSAAETFDCPESRYECNDDAQGHHSEDQTDNETDRHSAKRNRRRMKGASIEERSVLPRE